MTWPMTDIRVLLQQHLKVLSRTGALQYYNKRILNENVMCLYCFYFLESRRHSPWIEKPAPIVELHFQNILPNLKI